MRRAAAPATVFALTIVMWELLVRLLGIEPFLLPTPSAIVDRIFSDPSMFLTNSFYTAQEVLLGFGLAIVVGVALGIILESWPLLARSVYPLIVSAQTIPKVAIAPLFVIWFGFGMTPKVLITFLIAFFPIVIDTAGGLAAIDPDIVRLAKAMKGGSWATFWKVRLPGALPQMFAGFKVGSTLAVIGAVVGEFVGSDRGLGWLLIQANGVADTTLAFASIVLMAIFGALLFEVVAVIERLVIPWHGLVHSSSRA